MVVLLEILDIGNKMTVKKALAVLRILVRIRILRCCEDVLTRQCPRCFELYKKRIEIMILDSKISIKLKSFRLNPPVPS